jgi:hypothetical protein
LGHKWHHTNGTNSLSNHEAKISYTMQELLLQIMGRDFMSTHDWNTQWLQPPSLEHSNKVTVPFVFLYLLCWTLSKYLMICSEPARSKVLFRYSCKTAHVPSSIISGTRSAVAL